jgi:hypothetical protein
LSLYSSMTSRLGAESEHETLVQAFVSGVGFVSISSCEDRVEAAIGEDGHGYLYNVTTSPHPGPDPSMHAHAVR